MNKIRKPVGICGPYVWVVTKRPDMRHGPITTIPRSEYFKEIFEATMRKWR